MSTDVNQEGGSKWGGASDLLLGLGQLYVQSEQTKQPVVTQVEVAHLAQDRTEQQANPSGVGIAQNEPGFFERKSALGISNGASLMIAAALGVVLVAIKA